MPRTLYDRVFDAHLVDERSDGTAQLYVGLHYINEVTSRQAFNWLTERGLPVARPDRTVAVADHLIPEGPEFRPYSDAVNEELVAELEASAIRHGLPLLSPGTGQQGIIHVVGPELGLTQPGMVVCCGDSHTSTHGALGALGFGIGTSQVRDVLATQSLLTRRLAVRRVWLAGSLPTGTEAKDVILYVIRSLGVRGGIGHAYEYAGPVVERFSIDDRMTLCNMSIEGGAQVGYVCPDSTAYAYLAATSGLTGAAWSEAMAWWKSLPSDKDAPYADEVSIDVGGLGPMVTWGINPSQSVLVDEPIPEVSSFPPSDITSAQEALAHMRLEPGRTLLGTPIDVAFVGSCANSRLSDIARAVDVVEHSGGRVAPGVRAVVTPGSQRILREARERGWVDVLEGAGFTVGQPGCSLCVGLNGAPLAAGQLCASTSTRNFKGRQGAATGRTLLMSPTMVAAAALAGRIVDVRDGWAP